MQAMNKLEKINPLKNLLIIIVSFATKYMIPIPKKNVRMMATPPIVAVGSVWEERWFGVSRTLECRIIIQHIAEENKNSPNPKKRCLMKEIEVNGLVS